MKRKVSLIVFLLYGLIMSAQQDTCMKNIWLDQAMITAEKIKTYRDYDYVMADFEIVNDKFYILQRNNKSLKDFRILITNMVFEPIDTIDISEKLKPAKLEFDIAENIQIVTQDSLYQIVEADNNYYYTFPVEKNHYREVMNRCLFMTDQYVYFCRRFDCPG